MLTIFIIISVAAIAYAKWAPKSVQKLDLKGLPVDFPATHRHMSIALDSATKRLWVRDESGRERVLEPHEIIGWDHDSVQVSKGDNCWSVKNYLVIRTTDIDHPIWRARFKRHQEAFVSNKNRNECAEWFNRLNAVYNHPH